MKYVMMRDSAEKCHLHQVKNAKMFLSRFGVKDVGRLANAHCMINSDKRTSDNFEGSTASNYEKRLS